MKTRKYAIVGFYDVPMPVATKAYLSDDVSLVPELEYCNNFERGNSSNVCDVMFDFLDSIMLALS